MDGQTDDAAVRSYYARTALLTRGKCANMPTNVLCYRLNTLPVALSDKRPFTTPFSDIVAESAQVWRMSARRYRCKRTGNVHDVFAIYL